MDLLFESDDDFSFETFEVEECFEPNEDFVPTLEQTILHLAYGLIENENEAEMDVVSICNEMISSLDPKEESFIENDPISFEISTLSDDNSSLEFEFLSSPFSFTLSHYHKYPMNRCRTLKRSTLSPTRSTF